MGPQTEKMDCFVAIAPRNDVGASAGDLTPPAPINPSERIDAIDVLRGIALFGVMAINITSNSAFRSSNSFCPTKRPASPLDHAVETVLTLAIDLKALRCSRCCSASGLAIQFERLSASPRRTVLLVRRLSCCWRSDLIHLCLIWNGDILTEYALAGLYRAAVSVRPALAARCRRAASLGLVPGAADLDAEPGIWPDFAALTQNVVDAQSHLCDGRLRRRADLPPARESRSSLPCTSTCSAHHRAVSARRLRLARRPVALCAGQRDACLSGLPRAA